MTPLTINISKEFNLDGLLEAIISDHDLHIKWLNTLSYLENCGARKIARFQAIFKDNVPLSILQHACEESRHAFFMKKQILKFNIDPDSKIPLLGDLKAKNFLHTLDIKILKLLKKEKIIQKDQLFYYAYLLTTYAIEKRAEILYGLYQDRLTFCHSQVSIKSIIKEEENHLEEIETKMKEVPLVWSLKKKALEIESSIFFPFIQNVIRNIACSSPPG